MSARAEFISRTGALLAVVRKGRAAGVPDAIIEKRGHASPVYRRGQLKGYHAWVPTPCGTVRHPILEGEI